MTRSTFLISIYILYIYLQFCRHRYPTSEWGIEHEALGIGDEGAGEAGEAGEAGGAGGAGEAGEAGENNS
nr:hypothetical protein [Nostoc sp. DedQUE03]MDZ7973171.1 hypothetical protein [Nostoc sp. DedQUE03]